MKLILDLCWTPSSAPVPADARVVTLAELAAARSAPGVLREVLWGTRYESVLIRHDELRASGVQALAAGLGGLARTRQLKVDRRGETRVRSRADYLVRATAVAVVAVPREIVRTSMLRRKLRRIAVTSFGLPSGPVDANVITYLRCEPTIQWLGAQVGGAATHTSGVINGLVAAGRDVHAFGPERPQGTDGVPFTAVPLRRVYHLVYWFMVAAYGDEIVAAAQRRPCDAVYQRYALGSQAGLELARRLNVPLILEFNGSEIWASKNWGNAELPMVEALAALEHRNLTDASLIVVVSDVLRDQLVDMGIDERRVLVNPNGVDVDRLAPLREQDAAWWRRELGREEAPTIGFIGTFGLWHGVKLLPQMIAEVAKSRPDARWVIIGDGLLRDEVAAEVERLGLSGLADLTGIVPHADAVKLLASCDVCVSPHVPNPDGTRFFGSPTKLFEYMGLGKPIVASDLEQIGEVLDHERSGLLCAPGDVAAAADCVVRLLGDPELAARLGAAALDDARERYSWVAHVRRILEALAALPQRD